jgi:hypothetical protein
LIWSADRVALAHGWARLYDLDLQRQAVLSLSPHAEWLPFDFPPPVAWLALPFALLPLTLAFWLWFALLALAWTAAWRLLGGRPVHLALLTALFPVAFGLGLGQPDAFVVLALAAGVVLLERERDWAAGLVLAAILLKPTIAGLVPIALLAAGRWRAAAAFFAAALVVASVAYLNHGPDGLARYLHVVVTYGTEPNSVPPYTLPGIWPAGGIAVRVLEAVVAGAALFAAWRLRAAGVRAVVGIGLLGSLLATPHLHLQDLALIPLAAWLLLGAVPGVRAAVIVAGGWVAAEVAVGLGEAPLAYEVALLAAMVIAPRKGDVAELPR